MNKDEEFIIFITSLLITSLLITLFVHILNQ